MAISSSKVKISDEHEVDNYSMFNEKLRRKNNSKKSGEFKIKLNQAPFNKDNSPAVSKVKFEDHSEYYQKVDDLVTKRSLALGNVLNHELHNIKPSLINLIVENCSEKANKWLMNSDALYFPSNGMLNPQIVDTVKISNDLIKIFETLKDAALYKMEETFDKYEKLEEFHVVPKLNSFKHDHENEEIKLDAYTSSISKIDKPKRSPLKLDDFESMTSESFAEFSSPQSKSIGRQRRKTTLPGWNIDKSSNNPLSPMHDDGPGSPLSIELKKLHKQNQIMRKNYLKEIQNLKRRNEGQNDKIANDIQYFQPNLELDETTANALNEKLQHINKQHEMQIRNHVKYEEGLVRQIAKYQTLNPDCYSLATLSLKQIVENLPLICDDPAIIWETFSSDFKKSFFPMIEKEFGHLFNQKNQEVIGKEIMRIK